jgi:hypothetical protein
VDSGNATLDGPWRDVELTLTALGRFANPYTDIDVWATFEHDSGLRIRRPAFWDGQVTWRIRFASPRDSGKWRWTSTSSTTDLGLAQTGEVNVVPRSSSPNAFTRHGFWKMSSSGRSLVHADGTPAILVADTAWALPWRATHDQVRTYAKDRQGKGFNAALLMSVQPDMRAVGPRARNTDEGFDVGFEDLATGRLTRLNPYYFQYVDQTLKILLDHGIVPVLQPVFQGFGWKGLDVAGTVVPPLEYARYCRYLVARYGAWPAVYLVGADGSGQEPQAAAGGREVHEWDAYEQPTGIHYRPHAINNAWQDARWLDFQWCQTGHTGAHVPERVADMRRNAPAKAIANGEPTYERTHRPDNATGWWQGHEAWSNLCAGGTMGVVYGAANLWQWRLHADEPGHEPYFLGAAGGWREALDYGGSAIVGAVGRILAGLPTTDMVPDWETFLSPRGLRVPGLLNIVYQEHGGPLVIMNDDGLPQSYRVYDPITGELTTRGTRGQTRTLLDEATSPRVIVFYDDTA